MIYWFIFFAVLFFAIIFYQKFGGRAKNQLRVLMYHKVSANGMMDEMTVESAMLEKQFCYIKEQGYSPVLLSQVIEFAVNNKPLPPNPILITFDDGYLDNHTNLYPLQQRHAIPVAIFLVPSLIKKMGDNASYPTGEYLTFHNIASMDNALVEFGLHSYDHKNYARLSVAELQEDIERSKDLLTKMGVAFQPCLAYPFGAYCKGNPFKQIPFFKVLARNKIVLAFRIGNRLNSLPFKNPLLIQRLNIKGNLSFEQFTALLKNGKRMFS